jgi:hypothetical protein
MCHEHATLLGSIALTLVLAVAVNLKVEISLFANTADTAS